MRVFSAVQPTGKIHLGNYLGALRQWVSLQEENECIFCIADLHAITVPYKIESFQDYILEKAADYLAVGVNPEKSIIFVQSQVKEHTELAWLLNTITPLGDLKRMTQFKEKVQKMKKNINAGIFNYPILMAADILLYKTELVPVGEDQKQHVELTRTIARKFNQRFGQTFKIPEVKVMKSGARIMSLSDPLKKMSKSDPPDSYIGLFEEPSEIKRKIMKAVTDMGKTIKYDKEKKPGISNLLVIYSLFANKTITELEKKFKNKGYEYFKKSLAELLSQSLEPFRKKREMLLTRKTYLKEILEQGRKKAQSIAQSTMSEVYQKMGLI
jgi:tryptophanyl-tRNA synthetase